MIAPTIVLSLAALPAALLGDCQSGDGSNYAGNVSETKNGRTCQKWEKQSPHSHKFRDRDLPSNYCRNPDGWTGVWCYTTDSKKRWELCDVEQECSGYYTVANPGEECRKGYKGIDDKENCDKYYLAAKNDDEDVKKADGPVTNPGAPPGCFLIYDEHFKPKVFFNKKGTIAQPTFQKICLREGSFEEFRVNDTTGSCPSGYEDVPNEGNLGRGCDAAAWLLGQKLSIVKNEYIPSGCYKVKNGDGGYTVTHIYGGGPYHDGESMAMEGFRICRAQVAPTQQPKGTRTSRRSIYCTENSDCRGSKVCSRTRKRCVQRRFRR